MNFHYDQRPMKQFKFALGFAFLPALALAVWLASPVVRSAGPFTVNSVGDTGDANVGDGECNDGAGNCTLRAAIEEANALAGTDTITFDLPGVGPHIIQLASGLPELSDSVNLLNSSGESITVRRNTGAALFPVFWIAAGNQTVQISGLTISNGNFPSAAAFSTTAARSP
jgi:CSLREA domain-containing protein